MMRSFKKKSDLGNGSHYVTGANTDGALQANPDTAEKSGESTDSDDDDFDGDDFNPDGAAIQVDLHKVGSIPGSSKRQPDSAAETLRKHQWVNDWHLPLADISFDHAHAHLKHSVYAMESG